MKEPIRTKRCKGKACNGSYLAQNTKFCDWCLLKKFNLEGQYDSEDVWSISTLYNEEDVVAALRKATGL
jgi:hypothetical protein